MTIICTPSAKGKYRKFIVELLYSANAIGMPHKDSLLSRNSQLESNATNPLMQHLKYLRKVSTINSD